MTKLLRSYMTTMIKHPALWVSVAIQIFLTSALTVHYKLHGGLYGLDHDLMAGFSFYGIAVSEVLTFIIGILIIGKDHQYGTIRNKIIIGFSRESIYFSCFLTILTASFIIYAIRLLFFCVFSLPLLRTFQFRDEYLIAVFAISLLSMVMYSAFATFVLTVTKSALKAMAICLSLSIVSMGLFLTGWIDIVDNKSDAILSQTDYIFFESRNYNAVLSCLYRFLSDFLPSGQALQVWRGSPLCLWKILLYLSLQIIGFTTGGAVIFKFQNIK